MISNPASHQRLMLDGGALVNNWRALAALTPHGTACGAAVKADGYGLGAVEVVKRLQAAGCRDFYVATWQEAAAIETVSAPVNVTVLNGILPDDLDIARRLSAKPMLNSPQQVSLWRDTGLPCDVMIDTGMNRLGLSPEDVGQIDWHGIQVDVLASHLASADEDSPQNQQQLTKFKSLLASVPHARASLANSAGIVLGQDYAFDLTRPGLSLYGGIPRAELNDRIQPVGKIQTRILQTRNLAAGDTAGYNATFTAIRPTKIAIISMGYADGYLRNFSNVGIFFSEESALPVAGRVSMDLVALNVEQAGHLEEGNWVELPLDLPTLSAQSGLSQYELLTGLGSRFDRVWSG